MKKKAKAVGSVALLLLFLALILYFLLAFYYFEGFPLNTWINGVYCTGKTVEEVNEELLLGAKPPVMVVTDREGNEYQLDLEGTDYITDYRVVLHKFQEEQSPWLWVKNLIAPTEHTLKPVFTYNRELLEQAFLELPPVKRDLERREEFVITYSEETGYQLLDGLCERFDRKRAFEDLELAAQGGEESFSLAAEEYYYDIPLSEEQGKTKELWEKVEDYYRCDLVYDMGTEQIAFTPAMLSRFLAARDGLPLVEEGKLVLDEESVKGFVDSLAEQYDTYKKDREFSSTRGETVTVPGKGTYGTQLNRKKEVEFLLGNLLSEEMHQGAVQLHIPAYKREPYVRGLDDIGSTYIEIDMTAQKLYFYVEGELLIETDIVTGNVRRGWKTSEGVNFIYAMQRNRILRGEGYASPVDYWMPVKGGIGIHDADWRNAFGGDIYLTNGSHGCINIPAEIMPQIYELAEVGMPVIMFY